MMHCLKESGSKLPLEKQTSLESSLYDWLKLKLTLIEVNKRYLLATQAAYPEALLCRQLERRALSACDKGRMAELLGYRLTLPEAGFARLLRLTADEDSDVRYSVADALGNQASLSEAGVACLISLAADEASTVRASAAYVLGKQPLWCCYKLIAKNPALMQELYEPWIMPANYRQIIPFYLDNHQLYFYSDQDMTSVQLDQPEAFKQAILSAQQAIGIPLSSQIKTTKGFLLPQSIHHAIRYCLDSIRLHSL